MLPPRGLGPKVWAWATCRASRPTLASNLEADLLFSDTLRFWLEDPQTGIVWLQRSSE